MAFRPHALRSSQQPEVRLRWLGTAGFELACEGRRLLIDPYLSRPTIPRCLLGPLRPNLASIRRHVPAAEVVVVGHTHFDHALDVPAVAHQTGAAVVGSRSAMRLCRSAGLPADRLHEMEPSGAERATVQFDPFTIECARSVHAPIALGRIPFPGHIEDGRGLPLYAHQYRCGTVLRIRVSVAGRTIVHLGSAALPTGPPADEPADLLLLCASGWHTAPQLPERALAQLAPRRVLLSHWDDFFRPLHRRLRQLPRTRLDELVRRLRQVDASLEIGTVPALAPIWI